MASILIRTVIIYLFLSVTMKVMGKRQLGELEASELVTTFIISEITAIPIDDPDIPLVNAFIPILFIVCAEIILSFVKNKTSLLKSAIDGKPSYIIYNGKLIQKTLIDNRISINEFFAEARLAGFSDIRDIKYAIIESNGKISILGDELSHILVADGEIYKDNLRALGRDETWLQRQLQAEGATLKETFLMTANDSGETTVVKKEDK